MTTRLKIIILLILLTASFFFGRKSVKQDIKTVKVEVEKIVYVEKKNVEKNIKKKITIKKDGTKTIEIEDKGKILTDFASEKISYKYKEEEKKENSNKNWGIGAMYNKDQLENKKLPSLYIERRLLGLLYIQSILEPQEIKSSKLGIGIKF